MEKTRQPRIVRGITQLVVPHGKGEIAFDSLSQGPHNYSTVGKGILARGLKLPIGDYSASLLHAVYCNPNVANEPEFKEIREIMKRDWLWVFNRNQWTSEGVYVVQDLDAIGLSQSLDVNTLEKKLKAGKEINGIRFSRDGRIRFAPKGSYKLGEHTPESLAKDGFVIAGYGVEGAEKLGEVSAKFSYKPITYGLEIQKGQNSEQRLSALYGDYGSRLYVDGDVFDVDRYGHAFGVLKSVAGTRQKK